MKFSTLTWASIALSGYAAADLCSWDTLLGLGSLDTLPYMFNLIARQNDNTTYPVVQASNPTTGFFFPLSLGSSNTSLSDKSVPVFQLQGGTAYVSGGLVTSSMEIPLLLPVPIFVSSDSRQIKGGFNAVNSTCAGEQQLTLRFTNILPLPLASAAVNNTFAPGSALLSPILDNILTLFAPIDLIVVPINSS